MATAANQSAITLSLVDRLFDLEPDSQVEAPLSSWEQFRVLKAALCRDLAVLLNTRRAEKDFDPAYEDATNSLLSFGITDFTSYNLKSSDEQEQVRRSIERAIRLFEPRLARVSVSLEETEQVRPVLQFQIDAVLRVGLRDEPLMLDVSLQRDSRRIAVTGGDA
jgi:type VI secretion system protein ImpF